MASLDSLPADQRAVIQLVLQQGRRYDDIAALLSIDRAGVRQRALDAFDALGPGNSIPALQRGLLTDYLLGQLPPRVADQVHDRIAETPAERAWLRVVASEVSPLAADALPEIPASGAEKRSGSAGAAPAPAPAAAAAAATAAAAPAAATPAAAPPPSAASPSRTIGRRKTTSREPAAASSPAGSGSGRVRGGASAAAGSDAAAASRRGGAIVLGLAALIIAAVVVVLLVTAGGNSKKPSRQAAATTPSSTTSTSTNTGTGTSTTNAKLIGQVNLNSPTGNKSTKGIAQIISQGSTLGVLIVATHVPANTTHNAYAVWLYNSSSDSKLVGFLSTRVGSNGRLETDGPLPSNASHYKQLLITLETHQKPKGPGPVLLSGPLKIS